MKVEAVKAVPAKKGTEEGFWAREVRLFKEEMSVWGVNTNSQKSGKKAPAKKGKVKKSAAKKKKTDVVALRTKLVRVSLYSLAGIGLVLSFSILCFAGGVYAYRSSFSDRAYYGTRILGMDVSGKNLAEVQAQVAEKVGTVSLNFSVEGQQMKIKPTDAGINFNPDGTAVRALTLGKTDNWYDQARYLAASLSYKASPKLAALIDPKLGGSMPIEYSIDSVKLSGLTQNLSQSFNVQSQNAGLVMKGTDVQVIPAVYGRQIITDSIKTQIEESIAKADSVNIAVEVEKINPAIVEADTQKSIDAAKVIVNTPVRFHYQGKEYVPDKQTIGGWIVFNTQKVDGKDQLVPSIDAKLVYPYIYSLSSKINVPAVNKKVVITNGSEQKVEQEGKDGLAVDVDSASYTTAQTLSGSRAVDLELPTYAVKAKTTVNNITVADWAKYIDINISSQTMCAYLAGGNQQGCWSITSGATAKGYYTPTGTFLIQRKVYVTSMPNPPSPYPLTNIHYVSYFTSAGHAIHEAWWRSSFGGNPAWNGSHGCVNAPIGVAQWIYDWAPIGTPVIIHY